MTLVILFVLLMKAASFTLAADPLARFTGNGNLQIGFGENCYLFWRGDSGYRKNGEFRCGTSKGDPIMITGNGPDNYMIWSGNKGLFWNGDEGLVKNAEFRSGKSGDKFWIRKQSDGTFAIGFKNCPLFWRGDKGNVKNGEFRCGESVSDTFWIKGEGCKATSIQILPGGKKASRDGEEIVGIATAQSCSNSIEPQELTLSHTKEVVESVGVEISKSKEVNWQLSTSVSVSGGVKIFGVGLDIEVSTSVSTGGSTTYGSSKSKSTSTGTSKGTSSTVKYATPGGAMIVGFSRRYKFDKENMPARVTVDCQNGHSFQYTTSVKLTSQTYGQTSYRSVAGRFIKEKCNNSVLSCVENAEYRTFESVKKATETFKKCFPPSLGQVSKR